jgi:hypothetical protein
MTSLRSKLGSRPCAEQAGKHQVTGTATGVSAGNQKEQIMNNSRIGIWMLVVFIAVLAIYQFLDL